MGLFSSSHRKKLKPARFDSAHQRWEYAEHDTQTAHVHAISCATFNVWFGEDHFEERCLALLALLEKRRPDVIALQEVTIAFLAGLRSAGWLRREYVISDIM